MSSRRQYMSNKNIIITLVLLLAVTAFGAVIVPAAKKTARETDRSILKTALANYYADTGTVPLYTDQPTKDISPIIYDALLTVFDADYIETNMYPVNKELLRQAGALSTLNNDARLWVGALDNPAFIICEEDAADPYFLASIPKDSNKGDISLLSQKIVDHDVSEVKDVQMISTDTIVIGGYDPSNNLVSVNSNGDVTKSSSESLADTVEYITSQSSKVYTVVNDGSTGEFKYE